MSSLSSLANSTVVNSVLTNTPTVAGLASGLDTNKIIQGLLAVRQAQIDGLQANENQVVARQTAFKGIEARLLTLQSQIFTLARSQNSVFDLRNVTSSDPDLLTAAANSSATPGVYNLRVNSLATVQQIASQGYDSATAQISQGSFQIGSGANTATITIDGTNNNLQGLASAINNAAVGVSASIVNDGSATGNQPFRLVLTAGKTGVANAISITNGLAADGSGAIKPVFDATYIGQADNATGYTGTAVAAANTGAGGYTGATNNSYRFTVINGGTVGTDDNLQISYTDNTGAHTGTITLNSGDAGVAKTVAEGLQIQLGAGTLVAGQSFSVKTYASTLQQATDASVTLGSGSGALTVQSASNQMDGLIGGVTLNLQGADPTNPITLSIANDTSKASDAIQTFVSDFNDLMKFIDDQVSFDPQTGQAGVLLGNSQATAIQDQLRTKVGSLLTNLNPKMNRLGALGIAFDDQGHLTVDQSKLTSALSGQISGVTLTDVRRLFALTAASSDPNVQFVTGSVKTKSSTTPYQVNITQAARQATMTATNALASSTTLDNTNNSFTLTVDGQDSGTITLTAGTYTQAALVQEVQRQISAQASLAGRQATVAVVGGKLAVTSNSFGTTSKVTIGTGSALTALGFDGTESATGLDVAGSFIVNGVSESALGTGQFLVGSSTNANTADLQVRVLMTPAQVGGGAQTNLTVTRGLASMMDAALNSLLDPVNGRMKAIDGSFQAIEDNIKQEIDSQTLSMQVQQQSLANQFSAMEQAISQLQGIGNALTQQFNSLFQQKA